MTRPLPTARREGTAGVPGVRRAAVAVQVSAPEVVRASVRGPWVPEVVGPGRGATRATGSAARATGLAVRTRTHLGARGDRRATLRTVAARVVRTGWRQAATDVTSAAAPG